MSAINEIIKNILSNKTEKKMEAFNFNFEHVGIKIGFKGNDKELIEIIDALIESSHIDYNEFKDKTFFFSVTLEDDDDMFLEFIDSKNYFKYGESYSNAYYFYTYFDYMSTAYFKDSILIIKETLERNIGTLIDDIVDNYENFIQIKEQEEIMEAI